MKNKRGFTLVELVVAIAILGVITLIALPTISAIQANNKKTKYVAYEKAIKSASKAYVDAYSEDLYGGTNYGCAIVKYSEMKERDLIQDIQIKGETCDNDKDTFIYVLKDKQGNFGYFSNIVCRHGTEEVYSHKDDNRTSCELEKGDPPKIDVIFKPQKTTYYIGDHPKASIKISDEVGLKANQELDYVWVNVTTGKEITSKKTVKFENMHFKQRVTKDIDMPTEILEESMRDPTNYMLKVTGNVYDVNLNKTEANIQKPLNYFVGALLIKYKAGGAKMINPHGAPYSVNDSNDYVVRNGNDYNISKIRYKEENDLWDYNNKDYINIRKEHYHMVDKEEWKWGTKVFSQQKKLKVGDFNYTDESIRKENKTVEVEANWKIDEFTLTYVGGKCNKQEIKKEYGKNWGNACNPKEDGKTFKGWLVDGKIYQPGDLASTKATKDTTATAQWEQNVVKIYFNSNKGSIESRGGKYTLDKSYIIYQSNTKTNRTIPYGKELKDTDYPDLPDNNSKTYIYLTLTGYHIDPATAWSKNADGSGGSFDQTKSYPASDFCNAKDKSCEVVLYANWRKNQYTLTYDDNGGKGCSTETLKKYHNEKWSPLCTPKRDGYTFGGWKDKDTGGKVDTTTSAVKNTTVKAQWTEIPKPPKYTLTYDDNGGSGCSSQSITRTENEVWGGLCTPTKRGHSFSGWKDGSTTITATSKATKNVKVKADWTKNACTITYKPNSGIFNSNSTNTTQTCYYDDTCNLRNATSEYYNATRTGYHILSGDKAWYSGTTYYNQADNNTYKGQDICTNLSQRNESKDLNANWSINVCTITFKANGGAFNKNKNNLTYTVNYGGSTSDLRNPVDFYDAKNSYYYPKPGAEWTNDNRTFNQKSGITYYASAYCPNIANGNQSTDLNVNWDYEECLSSNTIYNENINKAYLNKIKEKHTTFKGSVLAFSWGNKKAEYCSENPPRRHYYFQHYLCGCKIDKNTKKFCDSATAYDVTSSTHPDGIAVIYYKNNTKGEKACKEGKPTVNSYVDQVCDDGIYDSGKDILKYHGYNFYKGKAEAPFTNFYPGTGSGHFWYHSGGDYNDRISYVGNNSTEACFKSCQVKFN